MVESLEAENLEIWSQLCYLFTTRISARCSISKSGFFYVRGTFLDLLSFYHFEKAPNHYAISTKYRYLLLYLVFETSDWWHFPKKRSWLPTAQMKVRRWSRGLLPQLQLWNRLWRQKHWSALQAHKRHPENRGPWRPPSHFRVEETW